ncbi:S1 family peptidase [Neptunomonas marina]|uniref:Serine protease n=1 Tax=Neptunomonas marina TaxID=1815562 RepID=A0A437Q8A5_9GAMM|nr:serine protease [Neptunomonas marina]RVU30740.1 serine protease [Neptunomonas marina]
MSLNFKRILACFIGLFLWCSNSIAAPLPDVIAAIEKSVVAVGSVTPNKRLATGRPAAIYGGTGFVVGSGNLAVTNYHVVGEQKLDDAKGERLAVFSGRGKNAKGRLAEIVAVDKAHDLAILRFEGPALPSVKLGNSEWRRSGESIALTGFPVGMVLGLYPVTHQGIISAITPIVTPAYNSKKLTAQQIKRIRAPFEVYQLDAIAYPGNSGSAVYLAESGTVIGVVNSVYVKGTKESALSSPTGITYAIPVNYVRRLLSSISP